MPKNSDGSVMELPGSVYHFGRFTLDPSNVRLTADGIARPLEPRSFRLLQFLIENRQRAVSKEEILTVVWDGVAVSDNALTRAIAQVRKALEDDPKDAKYIETIPTVGYRFLATVEEQTISVSPALVDARPASRSRSPWLIWAIAMAAMAVIASLSGARWLTSNASNKPALNIAVPFTTYPGSEAYPTFSPDGNQVAFTWNGEHEHNYDIYVKSIGSETPLRITTAREMDARPQWSPDGRYIAFQRQLRGGRTALMLIPPLGGAERKLAEFTNVAAQSVGIFSQGAIVASGLSWSRDGKWLAISGDFIGDGLDRINLVSIETGESRPLTQPP